MLLSASLTIMGEALANPERLTKSAFLLETDPNTGIYNIYTISAQYLPNICMISTLSTISTQYLHNIYTQYLHDIHPI